MFEGQPKGLFALALANTGERFGYYTMLAVFTFFLQDNFGWSEGTAGQVYSWFLMFVYFLPLVGGMVADKVGYGKCVTAGIFVMFGGYLLLSIPAGDGGMGKALMFGALALVSIGTSLFKGNLQVMVGNLYDAPELQGKRDAAFSIFYMAINIGAMFAPTAAVAMRDYAEQAWGFDRGSAYHFAFAVACVSLVVSISIYYFFKKTFIHADYNSKTQAKASSAPVEQLSKSETKERIVALCLVFAVVIFFWMAFHQNGATLAYFGRDFASKPSGGITGLSFSVWNLTAIVFLVYAAFSWLSAKTAQGKWICFGVVLLACAYLGYNYFTLDGTVAVDKEKFQQFNPFFVVALTPFSMAFFSWLGRKNKEPKAPTKIGLGMLVAALGYIIMVTASVGLALPSEKKSELKQQTIAAICEDKANLTESAQAIFDKTMAERGHETFATLDAAEQDSVVTKAKINFEQITKEKQEAIIAAGGTDFLSPNWLILTFLVLTLAELLLSPMGISFVSKVAPPKYKGLMMGGWFAATAIGNLLVQIPALLWDADCSLTLIWSVLAGLCLLSAAFIFSIIKRLNKVA